MVQKDLLAGLPLEMEIEFVPFTGLLFDGTYQDVDVLTQILLGVRLDDTPDGRPRIERWRPGHRWRRSNGATDKRLLSVPANPTAAT